MKIARIAKFSLFLSFVSAFGGCSTPAGLVATRPSTFNGAPADPALAAEFESFMQDHKSGWRKAPSILKLTPPVVTPCKAPEDYVLLQDAAGRSFSYGYQSSSLIRKRGLAGNYYSKEVPESEIYRLKGLLQQVPPSS